MTGHRCAEAISKLESQLSVYESTGDNPHNEALPDLVERIRAKYKLSASLMGTTIAVDESLSF